MEKENHRVEDRFAYETGGTRLGAAVFVADGDTDFFEWHYLSGEDYQETFDDLTSKGYRLVSAGVLERSGGITFGGLWRRVPGTWHARHGLSRPSIKASSTSHVAGFSAYRIQEYADSERFLVIWCKD